MVASDEMFRNFERVCLLPVVLFLACNVIVKTVRDRRGAKMNSVSRIVEQGWKYEIGRLLDLGMSRYS